MLSRSARNLSASTAGALRNIARTVCRWKTKRWRRIGVSSPTGVPFACHDERLATIEAAHDLAAVVAQFTLRDDFRHAPSVVSVIPGTMAQGMAASSIARAHSSGATSAIRSVIG
jgi:hypothetical protein